MQQFVCIMVCHRFSRFLHVACLNTSLRLQHDSKYISSDTNLCLRLRCLMWEIPCLNRSLFSTLTSILKMNWTICSAGSRHINIFQFSILYSAVSRVSFVSFHFCFNWIMANTKTICCASVRCRSQSFHLILILIVSFAHFIFFFLFFDIHFSVVFIAE